MTRTVLGKIGIIGGSGWLGAAMLKQMLEKKFISAQDVYVSNRSGQRTLFLQQWPDVHVTQQNEELVHYCDTIILSVRPQSLPSLKVDLSRHLVVSVMAGVTIAKIAETVSAERVVRAMPNAAAEIGESYTPWFASSEIPATTLNAIQSLLQTFGTADQVQTENEIDFFTALTGSGQGWVAYFEKVLIQCGIKHGINPDISERAVRQLFCGMGKLLADAEQPMDKIIKELIEYAGTTAAGLQAMGQSNIAKEIEEALDVSYKKATSDLTKTST